MGGNSSSMAAPVIVSATAPHTASVIFLHGLGDTGHGWASALQSIRTPYCKYICPTASSMPVTLNAGFRMPSWFDLKALDIRGPEDEEGINTASETVLQLIATEVNAGIPANRIIVGGFSQGGALAIYSSLRSTNTLAGIIGCSCWLPLYKKFPDIAVGNKDTPLLQCHGDADSIVPYTWGVMTSKILRSFMSKTEFRSYKGMMHSSCEEELMDIKEFIERCAPPL